MRTVFDCMHLTFPKLNYRPPHSPVRRSFRSGPDGPPEPEKNRQNRQKYPAFSVKSRFFPVLQQPIRTDQNRKEPVRRAGNDRSDRNTRTDLTRSEKKHRSDGTENALCRVSNKMLCLFIFWNQFHETEPRFLSRVLVHVSQ